MSQRKRVVIRGGTARRTAGIAVAGALAALAVGLIGGAGGASAAVGMTDLSLTKADTADPVTVGDTFGYVITVKNTGFVNDAGDVVISDTLPSLVSYVSATPSSGTCEKSGSKVTCDLGQVNAGASASATIMVKASKNGTASNTASLTSADDTDATNNLDTETTVINKKPSTPKPKKPKKQKASCAAPTILGTAGNDVLVGTNRADTIVALTGSDQVFAGGGNDLICAGGGADLVDGGAGKDFVIGGRGPDKLIGSDGGDTLKGKNGRDKLLGGKGDDLLNGGKKRDKCKGGPGRNTLIRCP
jgi:uncharacterized repeat protein (TIGR01451 family)